MVIRVLAIDDLGSIATALRKYLKKTSIHIIRFPNKYSHLTVLDKDEDFFESLNIFECIKKIRSMKDKFDLCFTTSWAGARIAYLADLNYVIFFVGTDIQVPPFVKISDTNDLKIPTFDYNLFERMFYKKVLENAVACIAGDTIFYSSLKKYRKDAIRIDRMLMDYDIYNPNIKPIDRQKSKFTFFSPQRFVYFKGMDLIFKAISLCKSEFEVLQVEWFDDPSSEGNEIMKELLKTTPHQVKFIPTLKRDEVARYYVFSDAVLGQMRSGVLSGVEREASLCKKPVIMYYNPNNTYLLDGAYVETPFLPNSNNPSDIAELIDKIVQSKEFRKELAEKEHEFVLDLTDPVKTASEWDNMFSATHQKHSSINRNSPIVVTKFRKILFVVGYALHSKIIKKKLKSI